jgi:ATPase subunit of ABC transporter with duplicated ATPase domains
LLIVSHDRAFLDNIVTSTFVFGAMGDRVNRGYEDWVRQRATGEIPSPAPSGGRRWSLTRRRRRQCEFRRAARVRICPRASSLTEQRDLNAAVQDRCSTRRARMPFRRRSRAWRRSGRLLTVYARWGDLDA